MTDNGPDPSAIDWAAVTFLAIVVMVLIIGLLSKACWV